ncbi:unnamed protein product, partial [Prorocentrum cordatum]
SDPIAQSFCLPSPVGYCGSEGAIPLSPLARRPWGARGILATAAMLAVAGTALVSAGAVIGPLGHRMGLADVHREKIFTCRQKVRCAMGQLLVEAMKSTLEDVLKDMRGMVESGRSPRGCCFPPAPPDGRAEGGRGAWRSKIT